jgi:hypothetical protein
MCLYNAEEVTGICNNTLPYYEVCQFTVLYKYVVLQARKSCKGQTL